MTITLFAFFTGLFVACGEKDESTESTGGDPTEGADLFATTCAACHGSDGTGSSGPDLTSAVPSLDDDTIIDIILNGTGTMGAQNLTEDEANDVLAYMRQEWG